MKTFLQSIFTVALLTVISTAWSQVNVNLNIQHLLDGLAYSTDVVSVSDLNEPFKTKRVEYYISGIKLVHDNGMVTDVPDVYLLVNGETNVSESLGSFNITTLEEIRFSIGVDSATNHLDPSTYPSGHPLAPQFPSMHWGWVSGYRFICMEGGVGSNFATGFEIHALGDANYFEVVVATAGAMNNGQLDINLDANYVRVVDGIDISYGPLEHSETGIPVDALLNMQTKVFTESAAPNSVEMVEVSVIKSVYPNPSSSQFKLELSENVQVQNIYVKSLTGKIVASLPTNQRVVDFNLDQVGIYILEIVTASGDIELQKLVVTQ